MRSELMLNTASTHIKCAECSAYGATCSWKQVQAGNQTQQVSSFDLRFDWIALTASKAERRGMERMREMVLSHLEARLASIRAELGAVLPNSPEHITRLGAIGATESLRDAVRIFGISALDHHHLTAIPPLPTLPAFDASAATAKLETMSLSRAGEEEGEDDEGEEGEDEEGGKRKKGKGRRKDERPKKKKS